METVFYTWDSLLTVAGATAATLLIVQYVKEPLDAVWRVPTRILALTVAFVLMIAARCAVEGIRSAGDVLLTMVNACTVALAAMGAYESTFGRSEG